MANWKRIEKLRDHLKGMRETKYKKFDMGTWISGLTDQETATVKELRENGKACGSAACLAGEAVIQFAPLKTVVTTDGYGDIGDQSCGEMAADLLDLDVVEADFMFQGNWRPVNDNGWERKVATKAMAVRYLTKVLEERDVCVSL